MSQPIVPIFVASPDTPNVVDGDLLVTGDEVVDGNLTVNGIFTNRGTFNPSNVNTNGNLYVGGTSVLNGNVLLNHDMRVIGNIYIPNVATGTGSLTGLGVNSSGEIVLDTGSGGGGGTVTTVSGANPTIVVNGTAGGSASLTAALNVNPNLSVTTVSTSGAVQAPTFIGTGGASSSYTDANFNIQVPGSGGSNSWQVNAPVGAGRVLRILNTGEIDSLHNVLDDGSGNVSISGTSNFANNMYMSAGAGYYIGPAGASDLSITWDGTNGIQLTDQHNAAGWLRQGNTTAGSVHTNNNILDDGIGNVNVGGNLNVTGTGGLNQFNGGLILNGTVYFKAGPPNSGQFALIVDPTGGNYSHLIQPNISGANINVTFPSQSGTLALTSQLPATSTAYCIASGTGTSNTLFSVAIVTQSPGAGFTLTNVSGVNYLTFPYSSSSPNLNYWEVTFSGAGQMSPNTQSTMSIGQNGGTPATFDQGVPGDIWGISNTNTSTPLYMQNTVTINVTINSAGTVLGTGLLGFTTGSTVWQRITARQVIL